MPRHIISSGSPFEAVIGLSRAVRIGNAIAVADTAPLFDGKTVHPNDVYGQKKRCLAIATTALEAAGATLADVIPHARDADRHIELARRRTRTRRGVR